MLILIYIWYRGVAVILFFMFLAFEPMCQIVNDNNTPQKPSPIVFFERKSAATFERKWSSHHLNLICLNLDFKFQIPQKKQVLRGCGSLEWIREKCDSNMHTLPGQGKSFLHCRHDFCFLWTQKGLVLCSKCKIILKAENRWKSSLYQQLKLAPNNY